MSKGCQMPGFVDIHIHGCGGYDVGTCGAEGLREIGKILIQHGVVGYLPTIPACSPEQCLTALHAIAQVMEEDEAYAVHISEEAKKQPDGRVPLNHTRILGAHLEGPFMKPQYKGALDADCFLDATLENWQAITGEFAHIVKRITIDPLAEGAMEMISYLSQQGITVSLGHTAADAGVIQAGLAAGASSVTHIYNAMPSLHHRNPGPVGAALADDACCAEMILDFLHVAPEAAKLVLKAKGSKQVGIITDACNAAGMPDGIYTLCGRNVHVINGEARMPEGQLASSTVFMDRELKNLLTLGFSLETAADVLSRTPAQMAGVAQQVANDVILLDENYDVTGAYRQVL